VARPRGVDDTVVVFVAGHGTHARDAAADYYFATHEIDVHDIPHTSAPYELIEALFEGTAARRRLLLMDTCESGERDDEDAPAVAAAGTRGLRARTTRAFVLDAGGAAPARAAVVYARDRFIDNDLARRSGLVVLSSSRGSEASFERDEWKNGAFTAELLRALTSRVADKDGRGAVGTGELRDYLESAVAARTSGLQHPTIDRDNLEATVLLPVVAAE
jgi:uncharacterized caspase-like protein